MNGFSKFFSSISPQQLDLIVKNPDEIKHLFAAQENETNYLRELLDDKDAYRDFIRHFNSAILKKVKIDGNIDKFSEKIKEFWRIETFRLISLNEMLPRFVKDVEEERRRHAHNLQVFDLLTRLASKHALDKREKELIRGEHIRMFILRVKPIGIIFSQVSEMFFIFEFNCKIICGMGCYDFARKLSTNEIIQHQEIWKTLLRLSHKDNKCRMCFASKTCRFKIDFRRMANAYACMMKIRQLADYSEIFYFHENLAEDLINYSSKSVKVVHKLTDKIIRESRFLWSPTTDEDFGITL